jgi:hypothetical protein
MMKKILFCAALLVSGAASAQSPARNSSPGGAGARGADPNETVCRNIGEIGSRLNRTRVCKTRAQWEEERRMLRQNVDRAQTNRISPDNS